MRRTSDSGDWLIADPIRRAELHEWLTHKMRPMFDGRVLPITEDILLK